MVPIYKGILLSHKKNEIMLFATTYYISHYHTKTSQTEKDKYHVITYMWIKKMVQMNLCTRQKYIHKHRKQTYGYIRGGGKRDKPGV